MDKDGVIAYEDIRKFMMSYSESALEEGAIETMLEEIVETYKAKPKSEEEATAAFAVPGGSPGPKHISFAQFQDLLNEVNDSIKKAI